MKRGVIGLLLLVSAASFAEQKLLPGQKPPSAPSDYLRVPLKQTQERTFHDASQIWSDKEVWFPRGASIWENEIKVDDAVVTVSQLVGPCNTPSVCPVRIRIERPHRAPEIFSFTDDQPCASGEYFFIKKDLTDFLACDQHFPLRR